jgi:beta-glucosidase
MGYRYYDAKSITPLFPFGFGLSYTTYTYSNLKITAGSGNTATVTFDITNTGSRSGSEIAELYVSQPRAAGEPPRVLSGFQKLTLAPGQTGHASIVLNARAFEHWDISTHAWVITPGSYQIEVGSSSRDLLLQGSITE